MKIVLTDSYDVQLSTALLGYVGETNARPVTVEGMEVDGADRYVLTIDYGDGTVYDVDISDGTWTPTADILRVARNVSCQISARKYDNGNYTLVKKSKIFSLRIGQALSDGIAPIPSPSVAADALDRMTALEDRITADVQTAQSAAETATTAAENAEKSATTAGVSADTATQAASRAETAKTAAETSATQAETAMQSAETARTQAVTAQNNAKISADIAAAAAQQTTADKTATAGYAQTAKTAADSTAADRQAVQTLAEQVTADKATVAENAAQVATDRTAAENAAQTAQATAASIPEDYTAMVKKVDSNVEDVSRLKEDIDNKITKFYASNQGETHLVDSDNGKIQDIILYGKSSQDGIPSPENPVEIKSVLNPTVKVSNEDGAKSQNVTLPYTLNAIPVSTGGNVTIDGQQYIADYVDVERGKVMRMCKEFECNGDEDWVLQSINTNNIANFALRLRSIEVFGNKGLSDKLLLQKTVIANTDSEGFFVSGSPITVESIIYVRISKNRNISTVTEFKKFLSKNPIRLLLAPITPEKIDLTPEEIQAFKALATHYPVTNISVNSEQLDGYTVFNYPISMANGWNYVKKQLNDNRNYIYDMDIQSAEAYVNSEYAVALTELEV